METATGVSRWIDSNEPLFNSLTLELSRMWKEWIDKLGRQNKNDGLPE